MAKCFRERASIKTDSVQGMARGELLPDSRTLFATHQLVCSWPHESCSLQHLANNKLRDSEREIFATSMRIIEDIEMEVVAKSGERQAGMRLMLPGVMYECSEAVSDPCSHLVTEQLAILDVVCGLAQACQGESFVVGKLNE